MINYIIYISTGEYVRYNGLTRNMQFAKEFKTKQDAIDFCNKKKYDIHDIIAVYNDKGILRKAKMKYVIFNALEQPMHLFKTRGDVIIGLISYTKQTPYNSFQEANEALEQCISINPKLSSIKLVPFIL